MSGALSDMAWRIRELARRAGRPLWGRVQRRWFPDLVDEQWLRTVMNRDVDAYVGALSPSQLDVVEISGSHFESWPWRSYTALHWPAFDLCDPPPIATRYDVIVCEQVLEHVVDPVVAIRTLRSLCRPGGHLVVSTPFLVRLHDHPGDYWRFTPAGLQLLLDRGGWREVNVNSWGNEACLRANVRRWAPRRPWSSLRNDSELPLVVWAFARNSEQVPE